MRQTRIDLMRHGEPIGGKRYRGLLDDPLSDQGWEQMRMSIGDRKYWKIILCSPLKRCADFARDISSCHSIPLEIKADLREMAFGEWEGLTAEQINAQNTGLLSRFYANPVVHQPPGGELLLDFSKRITNCWQEIVEQYQGQKVLLVVHAGVIRVILCHILSIPLNLLHRIKVPYASITRIKLDRKGDNIVPQLVFHSGIL